MGKSRRLRAAGLGGSEANIPRGNALHAVTTQTHLNEASCVYWGGRKRSPSGRRRGWGQTAGVSAPALGCHPPWEGSAPPSRGKPAGRCLWTFLRATLRRPKRPTGLILRPEYQAGSMSGAGGKECQHHRCASLGVCAVWPRLAGGRAQSTSSALPTVALSWLLPCHPGLRGGPPVTEGQLEGLARPFPDAGVALGNGNSSSP